MKDLLRLQPITHFETNAKKVVKEVEKVYKMLNKALDQCDKAKIRELNTKFETRFKAIILDLYQSDKIGLLELDNLYKLVNLRSWKVLEKIEDPKPRGKQHAK